MAGKKSSNEKGKFKMAKMFHNYRNNDNVTIMQDTAFPANLPRRINGKVGKIVGKRGSHYIVELKDFNEKKHFIVEAVHLKTVK
jgi:large subunit ribosomal protein L21e